MKPRKKISLRQLREQYPKVFTKRHRRHWKKLAELHDKLVEKGEAPSYVMDEVANFLRKRPRHGRAMLELLHSAADAGQEVAETIAAARSNINDHPRQAGLLLQIGSQAAKNRLPAAVTLNNCHNVHIGKRMARPGLQFMLEVIRKGENLGIAFEAISHALMSRPGRVRDFFELAKELAKRKQAMRGPLTSAREAIDKLPSRHHDWVFEVARQAVERKMSVVQAIRNYATTLEVRKR